MNLYGIKENEMNDTLTKPVTDAVYLTPAKRMVCREAITKVQLALIEYTLKPPSLNVLPSGLIKELHTVMGII